LWYLFFNLYKIFKVHKFLLDFLFADLFYHTISISSTNESVNIFTGRTKNQTGTHAIECSGLIPAFRSSNPI
ncbi:MAG: hypothetical protein K1W10_13070, partial [Lachnospiraceae bacterium]